MRVLVVGAAGNCGASVVKAGLKAGHDVTAFVRNREKLLARIGGAAPSALLGGFSIRIGDATDTEALAAAMSGQDAVVNAAGIVSDGSSYVPLVHGVIATAARTLGPSGRFWLFGGMPILDIPGASLTGLDLPGVPAMYQAHRANLEAVKATELDWSMLAPGRMTPSPDGSVHEKLQLSVDTWPFPGPALARTLPRFALLLAVMPNLPRFTLFYEDAAKVIVDHLAHDGPFSRKRVGVAPLRGGRVGARHT